MKSINFQIWKAAFYFLLLLPLIFLSCSSPRKAVKLTGDDIKNMVDSTQFVFVAERVTPMRGATRILTSRYDVYVKKDSLDAMLPYFGRAYQAPIDMTKGGIQFSTHDFKYDKRSNGNGWVVTIQPADRSEVQQLIFNIFENSTATLNVTSTHRDPISFYGHLERVNQ